MSLRDSINDLIKSGELNKIPVEQPDCVRFIDSRAVSLQSSQQLVEKPVKQTPPKTVEVQVTESQPLRPKFTHPHEHMQLIIKGFRSFHADLAKTESVLIESILDKIGHEHASSVRETVTDLVTSSCRQVHLMHYLAANDRILQQSPEMVVMIQILRHHAVLSKHLRRLARHEIHTQISAAIEEHIADGTLKLQLQLYDFLDQFLVISMRSDMPLDDRNQLKTTLYGNLYQLLGLRSMELLDSPQFTLEKEIWEIIKRLMSLLASQKDPTICKEKILGLFGTLAKSKHLSLAKQTLYDHIDAAYELHKTKSRLAGAYQSLYEHCIGQHYQFRDKEFAQHFMNKITFFVENVLSQLQQSDLWSIEKDVTPKALGDRPKEIFKQLRLEKHFKIKLQPQNNEQEDRARRAEQKHLTDEVQTEVIQIMKDRLNAQVRYKLTGSACDCVVELMAGIFQYLKSQNEKARVLKELKRVFKVLVRDQILEYQNLGYFQQQALKREFNGFLEDLFGSYTEEEVICPVLILKIQRFEERAHNLISLQQTQKNGTKSSPKTEPIFVSKSSPDRIPQKTSQFVSTNQPHLRVSRYFHELDMAPGLTKLSKPRRSQQPQNLNPPNQYAFMQSTTQEMLQNPAIMRHAQIQSEMMRKMDLLKKTQNEIVKQTSVSLEQYQKSCLQNSSVLFENSILQIKLQQYKYHDPNSQNLYLKLFLYITNKSLLQLQNFTLTLINPQQTPPLLQI